MDLAKIYSNRFNETYKKREITWRVLCKSFFSKYIKSDEVVLEIAAGYCHFINNIESSKKFAIDINPDIKEYASKEVQVILTASTNLKDLKENSIDTVFISNFFEHITKEDILKTLKESFRIIKPYGKIIILQPNIRFLYKEYWMFFDHITPLDEHSLSEALIISGFKKNLVIPKFLPFTLQGRLPVSGFLIKIYLKIPILWYFFGKQSLLIFSKENI